MATSNENTNGLVRQYLPKGIDLSIYSYRDLEKIPLSLRTRPPVCLGFETTKEVFITKLRRGVLRFKFETTLT